MTPNQNNQSAHGVLALLVALCLLMLILRLWPVVFLAVLALFVYGLWELFHKQKQPGAPPQPAQDVLPTRAAPVSEPELITLAFGLLQRRITEQVNAVYPHAKWVWAGPGAREHFAAGGPLIILLNGAGGYQRASVQVSDLQFYSLLYLPQNGVPVQEQTPPEQTGETVPPNSVDYGLLAFEWVEANLQRLYALNNEAVASGQTGFRILAEELPHGDSWSSICAELKRNGFMDTEPVANGIHIQIKQQGEENKAV